MSSAHRHIVAHGTVGPVRRNPTGLVGLAGLPGAVVSFRVGSDGSQTGPKRADVDPSGANSGRAGPHIDGARSGRKSTARRFDRAVMHLNTVKSLTERDI